MSKSCFHCHEDIPAGAKIYAQIDGVILKGKAKINESMITGESLAVSKTIKDTVMAGSRLDSGAIIIKSTAIGDDTILASLSNLLVNAQLQKPKTLLLADKLASWFVPPY